MNLIFIMLDSLRQDHVSSYNQGKEIFPGIPPCRTPNIDKFAQDCLIFENVYPNGLPTIPVRYELMTGCFSLPYRPWCPLTGYDLTIADILKKEGYVSGLISDNYHYRAPGMNYHKNFSIYEWIRGQEYDPYAVPVSKRKIENYTNENYSESWKRLISQFLANTDGLDEGNWFTGQVVEKANEFLKKARSQEKIFLWLDSFEPHEPWDPPGRFDTYTDKGYRGKRLIMPMGGTAKKWATREEINYIRGLYAGEVSFVDYCLGSFFENLEKLGYLEDSLVILTADHGHPLADHGKFLKGPDRMYSELLKVPFLIRLPGSKYGGRRIKTLIQFPDVLPTILEMLGLKNNDISMAGKSFYQVIAGAKERHRPATITGYFEGVERCIRNEKWSFVHNIKGESDMLFDLETDPKETKNLIDACPDIARELSAQFGNIFRREAVKTIKGLQAEYEISSSAIA